MTPENIQYNLHIAMWYCGALGINFLGDYENNRETPELRNPVTDVILSMCRNPSTQDTVFDDPVFNKWILYQDNKYYPTKSSRA